MKKQLIKQFFLIVIVFAVGVFIGYNRSANNKTEQPSVYSINGQSSNATETLEGLLAFDKDSLLNFMRNYAIYQALNEKYGSDYVEEKVDQSLLDEYKRNGIDKNDPTAPHKLGFNSKGEMRNYYRLNALMDRYMDEKISDDSIKETYKEWQPSLSMIISPTNNIENIEEILEEWEDVEEKSSNALYSFLKNHEIESEAIDIPYYQKMFKDADYQKMADLDEMEATTIESPSGDGELLVFCLIKTNKTDLETDKDAVKNDIKEQLRKDDVKFINQLMDELKIKGSDLIPLNYSK